LLSTKYALNIKKQQKEKNNNKKKQHMDSSYPDIERKNKTKDALTQRFEQLLGTIA